MPVIKSADTPKSISTFSMSDIEAHARSMLLKARRQAEQLLEAAQIESENLRKTAHAEGRAAGLAEGKREGVTQGKAEGIAAGQKQAFDGEKAKLEAAIATLQQMTEAFDAERHRVVTQAESEVLPLALAIARKVTRRMGEVDPAVVEANFRDAVRLINGPHDLRVRVNPDQHQLVEQMLPRVKQEWPQLKHVTIIADAAIVAGGCVVNTAGGEIDADLNHQLDRLIEELVGVATA